MKHWFIAGQGAVGSFIAYNAYSNNQKYTQIVRSVNTTSPVTFHPVSGSHFKLSNITDFKSLTLTSIEYLFVPLKAYDVINFLNQALPFLTANATIVLCHNGMGTIEAAKTLLKPNMDLFFCTTNNGLYKNGNGVFHAGVGESKWSHVAGKNKHKLINKDFTALLNKSRQVTDLQSILWQKLLINCVINPLTAIHNIKNGELLHNRFSQIISDIISETAFVANKVGVQIEVETITSTVYNVIKNTSDNYSSMNRDRVANKKTEIDFINGYITHMGKQLSLPTPTSDLLCKQIKETQSSINLSGP